MPLSEDEPFLNDYNQWKEANSHTSYNKLDYIYSQHQAKEINPDLYIALLELYWPTFMEHEGCIFLKEKFTEQRYKKLKEDAERKFSDVAQQQCEIELWMNINLVGHYFESEEFANKDNFLAKTLVEIYQTKLKLNFPHHKFNVLLIDDEDVGDYGLTFITKKR